MNCRIRRFAIVMGLPIACLFAGCPSASKPAVSTSTQEATVTGTVTINGKPATDGDVEFDPANYQRKMAPSRTAPIGSDSRYTITTLVGMNTVRVATNQSSNERGVAYESIQFDVKPGENTLDIVLPPARE